LLVAVIKLVFVNRGQLSVVAVAVLEDTSEAETGIESALLRGRNIIRRRTGIFRGQQNPSTHGNIKLLRMGETNEKHNRRRQWNERELSQVQPPFKTFRLLGMGRQIGGAGEAAASGWWRDAGGRNGLLRKIRLATARMFKNLFWAADSISDRCS